MFLGRQRYKCHEHAVGVEVESSFGVEDFNGLGVPVFKNRDQSNGAPLDVVCIPLGGIGISVLGTGGRIHSPTC